MSGKLLSGAIIVFAVIFGAVVYYTQVYHFYEEVQVSAEGDVTLTTFQGNVEPILYENLTAIDADSSPIRYRACFETPMSLAMMTETYEPYESAVPRNAPGWFDCFDAERLGAEIDAGTALVFTGQRNLEFGIDRVVAITEDGRGYIWHEINECGDKAYDGTPLGDDCPPREDFTEGN